MRLSFFGGLPVEIKHIKFWKNVLKLSNRKTRYNEKCKLSLPLILSFSTHDSITVKEEVVKVIGEVRGFKPVRLSFK